MGRFRTVLLAAMVLAAGMAVPLASAKAADLTAAAEGLGLSCQSRISTDEVPVPYIHCQGDVATFDGLQLDVGLTLPPSAGSQPLPTIVDLEGWPGGRAESGATSSLPFWPRDWHWNNVWWSTKGYATLALSPRGLGGTCNQEEMTPECAAGYSHLADKHFEVRDVQHLLGVLVDAGIADPRRLAGTGESYGGGQAWNLATSMPWTSAAGHTLQLRAAIPIIGWTDLEGSLVPNGRRSDDAGAEPGAGPIGVMQQSVISGFWALGRQQASARYGTDPTDLGSCFDCAYGVWSAGEPYAAAGSAVREAWRSKSALFNDDYLGAVADGTVDPVPVLAISGWSDPVFPVGESLQMYRRLKSADRRYPISLSFADIGHQFPANSTEHWQRVLSEANEFLDAHIGHADRRRVRFSHGVSSLPTRCDGPATTPVSAPAWDEIAASVVALPAADAIVTWNPESARDSLLTDPVIEPTALSPEPCVATTLPFASPVTRWRFATPQEMLGLPTLRFDYTLAGADGIVVAKLWDWAPDGSRTLVTRGVYRISPSEGDPLSGSASTDLFGAHWEIAAGHELVLELAASDAPALRPSNLPFAIQLSKVAVELPVR